MIHTNPNLDTEDLGNISEGDHTRLKGKDSKQTIVDIGKDTRDLSNNQLYDLV